MNIGQLNRRVTIQRPVPTPTGDGGSNVVWEPIAGPAGGQVWASVRYLSGLESAKNATPLSVARASIRIRWRTGIDPTCRVLLGDTIFEILAVLPDQVRREYIDLSVQTGANDG